MSHIGDLLYWLYHYGDVIMSAMASQITSLPIVYSTVYSGADQRKHQSSGSLPFVRGIQRGTVNSPHKGPVTRKMFPFDDFIMVALCFEYISLAHNLRQTSVALFGWVYIVFIHGNVKKNVKTLGGKWYQIPLYCSMHFNWPVANIRAEIRLPKYELILLFHSQHDNMQRKRMFSVKKSVISKIVSDIKPRRPYPNTLR